MKIEQPRIVLTRIGEFPPDTYTVHRRPLDCPTAAAEYWRNIVARQRDYEADKEILVVVMVNAKMAPIGFHEVSRGSLNEALAHPREVLRCAVIVGAYGFLMIHNHPSGDPAPSQADRRLTCRIRDASDLLQIRLLDHVVIGADPVYFSFRESGEL